MNLTRKDEMELHYWTHSEHNEYHRAKLAMYLWAFGHYNNPQSVLEIGCGPFGGVLPLIHRAPHRVGIDPLVEEYRKAGFLPTIPGVTFLAAHFESWNNPGNERFDAIFAADALDHGEMGFDLIPWIASLLNPGGRFFMHVNLRPTGRLNAIHDHCLTEEQLNTALAQTPLIELRREIYPDDIDGTFECPTLVGVWERPR